jgi:CubicO group peptidase (beta-lactamase class C family)
MSKRPKKAILIEGSVAPGFESVKALFEHEMNIKAEHKAQLCVYHQGKQVVDLWASKTDQGDFSADSLINIFSSGKSLECLAIASLVDKGLLSYDAKIAAYWPEFAANGKGDITVADLLRHEAGLVDFNHSFDPEHLLTENIKQNSVGSVIEELKANIPSDKQFRRNYHALTRGWLINELYRRVEPNGRTLGEYIREDISETLGADVFVGLRKEELVRREKIRGLNLSFYFLESFKPKFLGRKVEHSIGHMIALFSPIMMSVIKIIFKKLFKKKNNRTYSSNEINKRAKSTPSKARAPLKGFPPISHREKIINFFNQPAVAQGESSSFNASCSARGLAKVAAMMSMGGSFEGNQYFSKSTWQALHDKVDTAKLGGMVTTHFTQGGLNLFTMKGSENNTRDRALNKDREGFYGWMGLGGSIFQWHPEQQIGFAFVPTSKHIIDVFNERGKVYQTEVLACVKRIVSST